MRGRWIGRALLLAGSAVSASASAQPAGAEQPGAQQPFPRIFVTGSAVVRTPPDRATLSFSVRGEGATADEATRMLVARQRAIAGGAASLAGDAVLRAGSMSVVEARDGDCQNAWQASNRLSTGSCAVKGYVAQMAMSMEMQDVERAGTLTGLVARLGGSNVQLGGFRLADETAARRAATSQAIADARRQAEAIAAGAGVHLGALISVSDGQARILPDAILVSAARAGSPPAPPPPPPPVVVGFLPQPIETRMQLQLVYAIAR